MGLSMNHTPEYLRGRGPDDRFRNMFRSRTVHRGKTIKAIVTWWRWDLVSQSFECPSSIRSSFFCERVINIWNNLPANTVNFTSITRFRCSINNVDFSTFLKAILITFCILYKFLVLCFHCFHSFTCFYCMFFLVSFSLILWAVVSV